MSYLGKGRYLRSTVLAGLALTGLAALPAWAQEPIQTENQQTEDEASQETIVITGSRIRRNEFTSVRPVQILSGEVSRDIGLFDAGSILQESTVSTGLQFDTTFNGFVLDNGPGSTTADLRGLGASRTLVLLNGRRMGAAGVEGAPGVADLSLIPNTLIERYDVLLDGASSIYGSDAVAGVVNGILRKNFDGFEVEAGYTVPEHGAGQAMTLSARWGVNADRGFMGFGAEWSRQTNIRLRDREDIFLGCNRNVEYTSDGKVRYGNAEILRTLPANSTATNCTTAYGINRLFADPLGADANAGRARDETFFFGSLYYTPGKSNVGIPNFSELNFGFLSYDFVTNGQPDVDASSQFYQATGYPQQREADVLAQTETFKSYTYGEYNIGGDFNIDVFFEAGLANRQTVAHGNGSQALQAILPAANPFNVCNPNATGVAGVDCGAAFNAEMVRLLGVPVSAYGYQDAYLGARQIQMQVRFNLAEEDKTLETEITQMRFVGGLRGDVPVSADFPIKNISWEVSASYDRSIGQSTRTVIDDNALALSLATTIENPNAPGEFICGLDPDGDGIPNPDQPFYGNGVNQSPPCVAVNLGAPSLFAIGGGSFATQEEYDFLITRRTFDTVVEQSVLTGFVNADLFQLPAGTVAGVIGFEYRQDSIASDPDAVARNGQGYGFFSDVGANGTRDLYEGFAEIEVPLVANKPLIEELTLNASARFTSESNFGSAWTYGLSGIYRPTNYLTFRGGYGTSFRAPNLREQFLLGQSGFNSYVDPCIVPESAVGDFNAYDPSGETRDQITLDNCVAAGLDPTTLNAGSPNSVSVEVFKVQGADLKEETSRSWNAGFVVEQPWFDAFELSFAATYYDIRVEDTLVETGASQIIDDCYNVQPNLGSAYCGLITRDSRGLISEIRTPFVNQDEETAKGIDFNILFGSDFVLFERNVDWGIDLRLNNTIERDSIVRAPGADPVTFETAGEPYNQHWNGRSRIFADYGDFRVTWNTRWIGSSKTDFPDALGIEDTCDGAANGDVDCADIDWIDDYYTHDASLRWSRDTWSLLVGVQNVFDEKPQLVDEIFTVNGTNVPFNQDFIGRRFFVNIQKSF
ncbi:TonB-dependent receptor domain-containing protein [Woodsholea maritima]|uniref:TonB-dependent receptor domain-containing protein n=1 Tax=Woodsholea maritima TaxID=240237 RepID=UPI00037B6239|nr:TonB-dependent receptor [Woodsholea maritima]